VPTWIVEKAVKYGAMLDGAKCLAEDRLQQAIKLGIAKINIDTDLRLAFTATVREVLINSPKSSIREKYLAPLKTQ
jgi:fructose-bisphosphate aldolase class II